MGVAVILAMTVGSVCAEEATWYDASENWIMRVYTAPAGADYSGTLEGGGHGQ
jgi:hypothetical protein